jgi:hypothetical protein
VTPGVAPPPIPGVPPGGGPSQPDNPTTRIEATKPADSATPSPNAFPAVPAARPAGSEVHPAGAAERPAQTSFDVDLHEARAGDTYESIARDFYNDTRYARALSEYNSRRPVQAGKTVDVPPIGVLRQRYANMIGTTPAARSGTSTNTAPAGEWATPASPPKADGSPVFRSAAGSGGGPQTFQVPPGGMSLKAVARQKLGTEQRWAELYELNPQVGDPNAVPAGTMLKLPADARASQ